MRTKTIRLRSKKGMELVQVVTLTLICIIVLLFFYDVGKIEL